MTDRKSLLRALGHAFAQPALLETALTHRSFGTPHNERLEFLGDGVLNCIVADLLFRRFAGFTEGELTRLRAHLVRQDTLHKIASRLGLGASLRVGEGEERNGGRERPSILADGLEALIGAVYLDAGFERARDVVAGLYGEMIGEIDDGAHVRVEDAKTRLQELLQADRRPLPRYAVTATHGEAHAQVFEVACEIAGLGVRTVGRGATRRMAEQQAAEAALDSMGAK